MKKLLIIAFVLCLAPLTGMAATNAEETGSSGLLLLAAAGSPSAEMESDADFDDEEYIEVADPLEPINRGVFWFNDKLYFYLLKPVAKAFRVVPEPVRISLGNFFSNIATPIRFVNSVLQLKFNDAGTELGRFAINTTVGVLGLFDPARDHMDLRKKDEDTGQTFGHYGAGPGFYVVLPVLGPSSLRDGIGLIGDTVLDPVHFYLEDRDYYVTKTVDVVNRVSLDKDTYESIVKDNLDPYLFVRDAYIQHRAGKIAD